MQLRRWFATTLCASLVLCRVAMGCEHDHHRYGATRDDEEERFLEEHRRRLLDEETHGCGNTSPSQEQIEASIEAVEKWEKEQEHSLVRGGRRLASSRVIPVFVHLLLPSAADQWTTGGMTDSDVKATINLLNQAYQGTSFSFEWRSTTRTVDPSWYNCNKPMDQAFMNALRTGGTDALNVYICDPFNTGYRGWSSFPWEIGSNPLTLDGVVSTYRSFVLKGNTPEQRHTLTHEVGHWLGLFHTFEGQFEGRLPCDQIGDGVSDTPPHWPPPTSNFDCSQTVDTCGDGVPDPNKNYMNQNNEYCRSEFTPGQITRMQAMFQQHRTSQLTPVPETVSQPNVRNSGGQLPSPPTAPAPTRQAPPPRTGPTSVSVISIRLGPTQTGQAPVPTRTTTGGQLASQLVSVKLDSSLTRPLRQAPAPTREQPNQQNRSCVPVSKQCEAAGDVCCNNSYCAKVLNGPNRCVQRRLETEEDENRDG